jgi:Mn2+/Fe2+ NRAMP family transporter
MENHSARSVSPGTARERLLAARQAHDASVRRATNPAGLILAVSVLCGALTFAPAHVGTRHVLTVIAVVWLTAELVKLSARNQWRGLRSLPRPKWDLMEATLICIAVLVGGLVGPHLLASRGDSTLTSWGLGAAVAVTVAGCLFGANASYRRRSSRAWQQ